MAIKGLKKKTIFWATYWAILGIYLITLIISPETARAMVVAVVTAMTGLSGIGQTMNVADNYQRSKYYHPELNQEGK